MFVLCSIVAQTVDHLVCEVNLGHYSVQKFLFIFWGNFSLFGVALGRRSLQTQITVSWTQRPIKSFVKQAESCVLIKIRLQLFFCIATLGERYRLGFNIVSLMGYWSMDFDLKISLQRHRSRVQRLMCRSAIGRQGEILWNHTFELAFIQCRMMQKKGRVSSFCKVQIRFLSW